jgi:hypothetical protein
MLIALFAAYIAAAPLDAPHAAVLQVISHGEDAGACSTAQKQKMAAEATLRTLGRLGGDDVVLALVADPCICGAANCPYYAIRLVPGNPRVLLSTYAITVHDADHASPLPGLVVDAHSSAMVTDEMTYAFRGGAYVVVSSMRVRGPDHARKPNGIPVHFALGASSAQLHGTVSLGWYDAYTFDAAKGQRLTVGAVRSRSPVTMVLYGPQGGSTSLASGVPFTLPKSGSYQFQIENSSESDLPYTLRFSIR